MISAKSQNYSDMPTSGRTSDLSDYMVKLEKTMQSIDNVTANCMVIKIAIESAILKMKDGLESELLHKRYILFKSWDVISIDLGYERTQVHRIHGKALQHFDLGGINDEKE